MKIEKKLHFQNHHIRDKQVIWGKWNNPDEPQIIFLIYVRKYKNLKIIMQQFVCNLTKKKLQYGNI